MKEFNNVTSSYYNFTQNVAEEKEADPRILARSFLMYKIGK